MKKLSSVMLTEDSLEGLIIAGWAIGARKGYIYLRTEYPYVLPILENAIGSEKQNHCVGEYIFGSDFSFEFCMRLGAGEYVCKVNRLYREVCSCRLKIF